MCRLIVVGTGCKGKHDCRLQVQGSWSRILKLKLDLDLTEVIVPVSDYSSRVMQLVCITAKVMPRLIMNIIIKRKYIKFF